MFYVLLGILLGIIIYKTIKLSKFWEEKDIVHDPAWPIVGNMGSAVLKRKHVRDITIHQYQKYSQERYVGIMQFTRPMLMIRDLDLIKQITVKDFDHFHDHSVFTRNENDILLSRSLISLNGSNWRRMRATLSPVFTSSKMRIMHQLMAECARDFVGHFKGKEQISIEMKDIFSRFANDVIATTAFGIKVNSLDEPANSFFTMGRSINRGILQFLKVIISTQVPFLGKILGAQFFPQAVIDFFRSIIKDTIAKRQKEGILRPDMIHLLLEARKGRLKHESENVTEGFATVEESSIGQNSTRVKLTDDDIAAQAMLFFFAGFDTVSTASCFLAHELAVNPDIQKRLQDEIDEARQKGDDISYEDLLSLKYFDQVVSETLRLWSQGFQLDRLCTKDYIIPPRKPHEKALVIDKGTSILIPAVGIHHDPQFYPNPYKFDPERFSDENKGNIVSGTYLPFGGGPRNCIGSRFALLEIKTLFFYLLAKFDIVPVTGTQIPLVLSPKSINMAPENGFRLGFKPRVVNK